jgi:cysteine desulfurase
METHFGNPSSIHFHGREVKIVLERARKKVAALLNVAPSEIFFTSGGTEADNTFLRGAVFSRGVKHIVTSPIEHHAVLHTAEYLAERHGIKLTLLALDKQGKIDMAQLEKVLDGAKDGDTLVSLMHANNEVATVNDINAIAALCKTKSALFHSDTVQTMGHLPLNLREIGLDAAVGAAHKFHGPKGAGFLYLNENARVCPFITGGAQERNMRGGTENVIGIVGMVTALELAINDMEAHRKHVVSLKARMKQALLDKIPGVQFNGDSANVDGSLYTVLSVSLPYSPKNEMMLMNLDVMGVSASGGSACSSGSNTGSHVLRALCHPAERAAVRFSFSRFNTAEDIDYAVEALSAIYATEGTNSASA